jgi:hypothetical protein
VELYKGRRFELPQSSIVLYHLIPVSYRNALGHYVRFDGTLTRDGCASSTVEVLALRLYLEINGYDYPASVLPKGLSKSMYQTCMGLQELDELYEDLQE